VPDEQRINLLKPEAMLPVFCLKKKMIRQSAFITLLWNPVKYAKCLFTFALE
jgi:hypothetical protein